MQSRLKTAIELGAAGAIFGAAPVRHVFSVGNADEFLIKESVTLDSSEVLLLVPEDLAGGSDCILEEVSWVSFPRFHFPSFLGPGD
jgi:hypothetical protein